MVTAIVAVTAAATATVEGITAAHVARTVEYAAVLADSGVVARFAVAAEAAGKP
jgi:hypothetical protein